MRIEKVSTKLEHEFASIAAGSLSPDDFERLIFLFESEIKRTYFTDSSEANLIRIIHAMLDKVFFLTECIKYPHYVEILVAISANSNYLTDIVVVNPEHFYWIVNPSTLKINLTYKDFKKSIIDSLSNYYSFKAKLHRLKSIKRREILRIGLRDICSGIAVKEITDELSALASVLTAELFELCLKEVLQNHSITKLRGKYCLISLGKLGGLELNYSSDIDLILFYDKETKVGNKKLFSEFLSEAVKLFINSSSDIESGLLYRIDFRLRPDGRNAPICRSMMEYLNYYESRGENWERQMLLKAGYLSGSKSLYTKFLNYLTPFIFPSLLSSSPKEEVLKIKSDIERKINEEENIKLLPGGIRDIEFAVQVLQLLNGSKIKKIRGSNTLSAIEELYNAKLLASNEQTILKEAYIFYRKIEHYLQLMNDRQTHIIPVKGELLEKLSHYLGFKSASSFKQHVDLTRNKVRNIYNSILVEDTSSVFKTNQKEEIKFENKIRANNDFKFLRDGRGITGNRTFDSKSIESFSRIEYALINYLIKCGNPDKVLSNFVRIIKQSDFPSIWYNELVDEIFFKYLMLICEFSQYSVDLVAENKRMRDFLLSRKVFLPIAELELSKMNTSFILFYFSVQITAGLFDPVTASNKLSKTIRLKMSGIVKTYSNQFDWEKDYFVASLGSLGASTLTFYSDFDIVFIVRHKSNHLNIEKHFQNLLFVLKSELSPFTMDLRLRPEGESSQLVWDIKSAQEYFKKRSRVWEYQALTKINFIEGNKRLFISFTKSAILSISRFNLSEIKSELIKMRNNVIVKQRSRLIDVFELKKAEGTLNDIDFLIQYYLLFDADLFLSSIATSTVDKILLIREKIERSDSDLIKKAFNFYKSIEIFNQLIFNVSANKIYYDENKGKILAEKLNLKSVNNFRSALKINSENIKNIVLKTIS